MRDIISKLKRLASLHSRYEQHTNNLSRFAVSVLVPGAGRSGSTPSPVAATEDAV